MTQKVTVLSVSGDMARVSYHRPTACHSDCAHCSGGCGEMAAQENLIVHAENPIHAKPGDEVLIEGSGAKVASAILLVYVIPVVLFFLGYALGAAIGISGALCGIIGFVLGILIAVFVSRRQRAKGTEITFRIIGYAEQNVK